MSEIHRSILIKSDEVLNLCDEFLADLKDLNLQDNEEVMFEICSVGLFLKAVRTFKAIQILCKEDLNNEAHSLLRILAETCLILSVIYKEDGLRKDRVKKLLAYNRIVEKKFVDAYHQNPNLGDMPEKLRDKLTQQVAEIENEYGKVTYEEMRKNKKVWKGMLPLKENRGIKEVMDYVGFNNMYDSLYRIGSKNIHADDFLEYITITEEGPMLLEKDPRGIEGILVFGTFFVLDFMGVLSDSVKNGLQFESKIKSLKDDLQKQFDNLSN